MNDEEFQDFISERIVKLRAVKKVSARDMSLSIGQNVNYINNIENQKAEPSLTGLIYICEYFKITPGAFFDEGNPYPERIKGIVENIKQLDSESLAGLAVVVQAMAAASN